MAPLFWLIRMDFSMVRDLICIFGERMVNYGDAAISCCELQTNVMC